jgi:hemerythrin superfamily protein
VAETETTDAVTILQSQHDDIRRLLSDVQSRSGEERASSFQFLVRLLAVHETSEEEVIYPAVRQADPGAADDVEARKHEEDEAKKVLADLERMDLDSPDFLTAFEALAEDVEAHASAEERTIFPVLERQSDATQLEWMGRALTAAQAFAPTHAHRSAPEGAMANMIVGPLVAVMDRVRDAIHDTRR